MLGDALSLAGDIFGLPAAAALVVTLAIAWTGFRVLEGRHFQRSVLIWSALAGYLVGYAMLPRDFAAWQPQQVQPWTWLPYAGVWAAIVASVFAQWTTSTQARVAAVIAAALPGFFLVPSWPVWGLEPATLRWLIALYLVMVGLPLHFLPAASRPVAPLAAMAVTALVLAVAIGVLVSLRLAQLGAIAAAVFVAAGIAALAQRRATDDAPLILAALYVVQIAGIAWIACAEPEPPQAALLAIPLLPAGLWLIIAMCRVGIATGRGRGTQTSHE